MTALSIFDRITSFTEGLRQRPVSGSLHLVINTVTLLRDLIQTPGGWSTLGDLLNVVRKAGAHLADASPLAGNAVRRVLKIIREEAANVFSSSATSHNPLQRCLINEHDTDAPSSLPVTHELTAEIIKAIEEFLDELRNCKESISSQALEHVHSNEIIMTHGNSRTVQHFLKEVSKKRKFQVIVVECAPFFHGRQMARELASAGIATTLISDAAVFAMMARVNKVLLGAYAILADGGVVTVVGGHTIALAAKHYSVPFIVCAPIYKLTPEYISNDEVYLKLVNPNGVLPYDFLWRESRSEAGNAEEGDAEVFAQEENEEVESLRSRPPPLSRSQSRTESSTGSASQLMDETHAQAMRSLLHVHSPAFDSVPSNLVTLFVSNQGGISPSYLYRLLSELYDPEDYELASPPPLHLTSTST